MKVELYAIKEINRELIKDAEAKKENLTFVGEAVVKWKQSFEDDHVNQWNKLDVIYLTDEKKQWQGNQILSGQIFIWVIFRDTTDKYCAFQPDGKKKAPKSKYEELQRP